MRRLAIVLLLTACAWSQAHYFNNNGSVVDGNGNPVPNPTIRVCLEPAMGSPCSTAGVTLYSDWGLTQPLPNPFTGDAYGNVDFYSPTSAVAYHLQISAPGIQTSDIPYVFLMASFTNVNLHSPGPIGDVTPSTGNFTTLTAATLSVTSLTTNKINTTVWVQCPNCTDWGDALMSALESCPSVTVNTKTYKSCKIIWPAVQAGPWTTHAEILSPFVTLEGQGKQVTNFACTYHGADGCLLITNKPFSDAVGTYIVLGGKIADFGITGDGNSSQKLFYARDVLGTTFMNLHADNAGRCFTLEAYRAWSEHNLFVEDTGLYSCGETWHFDCDPANTQCQGSNSGSLGYNDFFHISANPNGAGQIGFHWDYNVYMYNGTFAPRCNKGGVGSTIFSVTNGGYLQDDVNIKCEENGSGGTTWNIDATGRVAIWSGSYHCGGCPGDTIASGGVKILTPLTDNLFVLNTNPDGTIKGFSFGAPIQMTDKWDLATGTNHVAADTTGTNPTFALQSLGHQFNLTYQPGVGLVIAYDAATVAQFGPGGDFSAANNLNALAFVSKTTTPATAGIIRLAKTDTIEWRNNANSSDNVLGVDSSNFLTYNTVRIPFCATGTALTGTYCDGNGAWRSTTIVVNGVNCTLAGVCTIATGLSGTTGTITGTALTATCDSGTAAVSGATVGKPVTVSTTDGTDVGGPFYLRGSVTSSNTVTVYVCGTGTPPSKSYNVTVLQ